MAEQQPLSRTIRVPDFLSGEGEVAALMRSRDWSKTSLGTPDSRPQSLFTTTRTGR
jgi:hypothetical protein